MHTHIYFLLSFSPSVMSNSFEVHGISQTRELEWIAISFCLQCRRPGINPWVWKIPWRRKFLPGKFHGQRS